MFFSRRICNRRRYPESPGGATVALARGIGHAGGELAHDGAHHGELDTLALIRPSARGERDSTYLH
jgi:hypothetical protein